MFKINSNRQNLTIRIKNRTDQTNTLHLLNDFILGSNKKNGQGNNNLFLKKKLPFNLASTLD